MPTKTGAPGTVEKIVINVGLGDAVQNPKLIDGSVVQIGKITGQRPVVTRSKKAISNFKLREKMPIGVSVTLRRERMYEFLERFIRVALPRVRYFRGLPNKGFVFVGWQSRIDDDRAECAAYLGNFHLILRFRR